MGLGAHLLSRDALVQDALDLRQWDADSAVEVHHLDTASGNPLLQGRCPVHAQETRSRLLRQQLGSWSVRCRRPGTGDIVGVGRARQPNPALSLASRCRFTSTARSSGSIALRHSTQGVSSSCSVGGRYGCHSHHSVHRLHTHPSGRPRLTGSGGRRYSGSGGGGGAHEYPRGMGGRGLGRSLPVPGSPPGGSRLPAGGRDSMVDSSVSFAIAHLLNRETLGRPAGPHYRGPVRQDGPRQSNLGLVPVLLAGLIH